MADGSDRSPNLDTPAPELTVEQLKKLYDRSKELAERALVLDFAEIYDDEEIEPYSAPTTVLETTHLPTGEPQSLSIEIDLDHPQHFSLTILEMLPRDERTQTSLHKRLFVNGSDIKFDFKTVVIPSVHYINGLPAGKRADAVHQILVDNNPEIKEKQASNDTISGPYRFDAATLAEFNDALDSFERELDEKAAYRRDYPETT